MFRRTSLRLAILLWTTAWFTLIVPAHQRGAIRLPGPSTSESCGAAAGSCCAKKAGAPAKPDDGRPVGDPVRCCAICKIVAKFGQPDATVAGPVELAPLSISVCERPVDSHVPVCLGPNRSRAPPTSV